MLVGAALAILAAGVALWLAIRARSGRAVSLRGSFRFDEFKARELARRGIQDRTKL